MVTGWEGIVHTKDHWKVASGCRVRTTKSHRGIENEGNAIGGHLATGGSHSEVEWYRVTASSLVNFSSENTFLQGFYLDYLEVVENIIIHPNTWISLRTETCWFEVLQ